MKTSFLSLVRSMFNEKEELTLYEIYEEISKNPKIQLSEGKLRHRIRSSLYNLKKNDEIKRISQSRYRRNI